VNLAIIVAKAVIQAKLFLGHEVRSRIECAKSFKPGTGGPIVGLHSYLFIDLSPPVPGQYWIPESLTSGEITDLDWLPHLDAAERDFG
jgi:hypothetical protein